MLAWDHNGWYHPLLLRRLPARLDRVLDVGCGTGELATLLAGRARQVDALDRDPGMAGIARRRVPPNVRVWTADLRDHELEAGAYDAITSLSALHHLDLTQTLPRLATALRPGGTLVAVALPARDLPRELVVELAATAWHHLLGAVFVPTGHARRRALLDQVRTGMPMRDPVLTTREVRTLVTGVLHGAAVRRLLLWRYLLVWRAPG